MAYIFSKNAKYAKLYAMLRMLKLLNLHVDKVMCINFQQTKHQTSCTDFKFNLRQFFEKKIKPQNLSPNPPAASLIPL